MTGVTMDRFDARSGEAAERTRRRRFWTIVGACFVAGLPVGFFAAHFEEGDRSGFLSGTLPPWFAVLASVVTLGAIVGGSLLMLRQIDEMERRDNLLANSMGMFAMVAVYPVWFLLWRGGLTGEPHHGVLFLLVFGASLVTYIVLKLRQRF